MNKSVHPLREALIVTAAALVIYILRLAYLDGGAIHQEALSFLRVYSDGRPFWQTIYNPVFNDWLMYQPRELSYFFDWIDSRFITASIHHGWVHFYSISCLFAVVATVFIQQYGTRKCFPRIDGRIVTLVSLIWVLMPLTTLCYYRSAKPFTALFLTAACFLTFELFRNLRGEKQCGLVLFSLMLALFLMTLCDRQGAFFAALYASFCGFLLMVSSRLRWLKNRKLLAKAACISWGIVFFGMIYNLFISPFLIYWLNGYVPDFNYQYTKPGDAFQFADGIEFIANAFGLFFTGRASWLGISAGILCVFLMFVSLLPIRNLRGIRILAPALMIFALAALIPCANVMAVKCDAILMPEALGNGSYASPMLALLVCFLFYVLHRTERSRWKLLWSVILSLSLVGHLLLYIPFSGGYPAAFEQYWGNAYSEEVHAVKYLLKHPEEDYRKYTLSYRSILLIRQMRGLPPFEDENRAYYYLRLYRGIRL